MSHDNHNHNNHSENKPVSFTAPLILGSITVFIILLFVSLGNPCNAKCCTGEECSKECAEACEKNDHSKHPEGMEAGNEHETKVEAVETENSHAAELPADTTKKATTETEVKEEAHH